MENQIRRILATVSSLQSTIHRKVEVRDAFVRDALSRGATYAEIGEALGMTRSSAWQQYGPRGARSGRQHAPDSGDA